MSFDERRTRILLAAAFVLIGAGVWAFFLRGADGPANPSLGERVEPRGVVTALPGDPERVRLDDFDEIAITVDPGGAAQPMSWCLLAALSAQQRARGLMEVTDLQGYDGMAFVYEQDVANGFYMRNTPTPLSIAWVAASGEVVTIKDMEPCEDRDGCPTYPSDGTYRYALEAFQGHLEDLGITPAAHITVGGRCASPG